MAVFKNINQDCASVQFNKTQKVFGGKTEISYTAGNNGFAIIFCIAISKFIFYSACSIF